MNFKTKYKICLWKAYFETGYAITNYLKYPLLLLGILNKITIKDALIYSIVYGIICFIIGFFWFKTDFAKASCEVSNNFNKLSIELRNKVIRGKRKI